MIFDAIPCLGGPRDGGTVSILDRVVLDHGRSGPGYRLVHDCPTGETGFCKCPSYVWRAVWQSGPEETPK